MDLLINLASDAARDEPSPWGNIYPDTLTPIVIPKPDGTSSEWSFTYDGINTPTGTDVDGQIATSGDASWVTDNALRWSHQIAAGGEVWATLLIKGPANATFTLEAFSCSKDAATADIAWRANGGTPALITQGGNTTQVVRFVGVTTDANGNASVAYSRYNADQYAKANAIRLIIPDGPSIDVTQTTLTPGGAISGTYSDYDTVPTTLTVSDGTNTITIATPTISNTVNGDKNEGTFSGAMPALPTSGTANLVLFGNVTVELS